MKKTPITLADNFTYGKIMRFTIPSIVMMIFTSIYGIVDGIFVSNLAGSTPFAAVNLTWPFIMLMSAFGFMTATGGNAVVSKAMGEGDDKRAVRYFSMIVSFTIIVGIIVAIFSFTYAEKICIMLGSSEEMLPYCLTYVHVLFPCIPVFMLQNVFQMFFVTAERPKYGLYITIAAGVSNIIFDAVFIGFFKWGIIGAAIGTAISQIVGGLFPLFYFLSFNKFNHSRLKLTACKPELRILVKTCTNGVSELMSNISMSLVNILYNYKLIEIAGENGVNAYGIIMYVNFIFVAAFLGYSIGSAPVVGFNYGSQNHKELQNVFNMSIKIIALGGILMTAFAELLSSPLSTVFVSYDEELLQMTVHGFRLFSISFLINGYNIYASSFFTALGNGAVSAFISCMRTLVFQIIPLFILPIFLGIDGIWLSVVVAEGLGVFVSFTCIWLYRNRYHYLAEKRAKHKS